LQSYTGEGVSASKNACDVEKAKAATGGNSRRGLSLFRISPAEVTKPIAVIEI
jgi:hypothetical protein